MGQCCKPGKKQNLQGGALGWVGAGPPSSISRPAWPAWLRQLQDKIQASSQFEFFWFSSVQLNKSSLFKLIHLQTLAGIQYHQSETMDPPELIASVVCGLL